MSKKEKYITHNIWLYIGMFCFAILCLMGAYLFYAQVENGEKTSFYFETECGDSEIKIYPWLNPADKKYYVFLPAGCQKIRFQCKDNLQFSFKDFSAEKELASDKLLEKKECTGIITNGLGFRQNLCLVFMKSENIPSLFISTESGSMDYIDTKKGNAESGAFAILDENGSSLSEGEIVSLAGRGNTSWTGCEKRGYKFTLPRAEALCGLRSSSEWILVANARSNYLSNSIAFWLEKEIGFEYYTNAVFVDLYLNGSYHGNYILCEKISIGDNGILMQDLDALNMQANPGESLKGGDQYRDPEERYKAYLWKRDPKDITGGYLIERDVPEYYADEKCGIKLTTGDHYVIHQPSKPTVAEAEYLWTYMEELHEAVASSDGYNSSGRYYTEYIDIESFALKYVLEEFLAFSDSGRSSAYYYKDSGDILRAGPGWDFEGAFLGNSQYLTMLNGTAYSTELFEQLMQHDEFSNQVIYFYETRLRPAVVELCEKKLYEFRDMIAASAEMDTIRWQREDFFDSCSEILKWIDQRIKFLDQHWNPDEKWISLKFESEWSNNHYLYLRPGEGVTESMVLQFGIPQVSEWRYNDGTTLQYNVPQFEDAVLQGVSQPIARDKVSVLIDYAVQIMPELLFGIVFFIVGLLFCIRMKKGRWKE